MVGECTLRPLLVRRTGSGVYRLGGGGKRGGWWRRACEVGEDSREATLSWSMVAIKTLPYLWRDNAFLLRWRGHCRGLHGLLNTVAADENVGAVMGGWSQQRNWGLVDELVRASGGRNIDDGSIVWGSQVFVLQIKLPVPLRTGSSWRWEAADDMEIPSLRYSFCS